MMKIFARIFTFVLAVAAIVTLASPLVVNAYDINGNCKEENCTLVNASPEYAANQAQNIIETALVILGALAVVMIAVGGLKYVTASGDQQKMTAAKHIVLYSVVGLIAAIMARGIVQFVIEYFG